MFLVKTVEEVRRERLQHLVQEAGGTVAALNRLTGKSARDSTYTQILNQSPGSRTGKLKEMGSKMARELEAKMAKERGWMDTDPDLIGVEWPFRAMDEAKVRALSEKDLVRLETVITVEMRRTFGVDIRRQVPTGTT